MILTAVTGSCTIVGLDDTTVACGNVDTAENIGPADETTMCEDGRDIWKNTFSIICMLSCYIVITSDFCLKLEFAVIEKLIEFLAG